MPRLIESDFVRLFDNPTMARAREYVRRGKVIRVEIDAEGCIYGKVQGSRSSPYKQEIQFNVKGGKWTFDDWCSCPVGDRCKHVAAVLLTAVNDAGLIDKESQADSSPATPELVLNNLPPDPNIDGWLSRVSQELAQYENLPLSDAHRVFYALNVAIEPGMGRCLIVTLTTGRWKEETGIDLEGPLKLTAVVGFSGPEYVLPLDRRLAHNMLVSGRHTHPSAASFALIGSEATRQLQELLTTGRAFWQSHPTKILQQGEPRPARPKWIERKNGAQAVELEVLGATLLPTTPPWYVDLTHHECGPLDAGIPLPILSALLNAPEIAPERAAHVRSQLSALLPNHPEILPEERQDIQVRVIAPTPLLTVTRKILTSIYFRPRSLEKDTMVAPVARLEFDYEGTKVRTAGKEIRKSVNGSTIIIPRQQNVEDYAKGLLERSGWRSGKNLSEWKLPTGNTNDFALVGSAAARKDAGNQLLYEFLHREVPRLRREGWQVHVDGNLEAVEESAVEWQFESKLEGNDWFGIELGVLVHGERLDLRPIFLSAFEVAARKTKTGRIEELDDDTRIFHELRSGKVISIPVSRIKPLFRALEELFGPIAGWTGEMRLPTMRAGEIAALDEAARAAGATWKAPERIRKLVDRLAAFEEIPVAPIPQGLVGELRPYQRHGYHWLQFLREFEFGGILADDMGLGKTVQTLTHILAEKEAGRLDRPALIVAPTSTIPNWCHEAERFAPSLKLLNLHGGKRAHLFPSIPKHDLILTSFALLGRDKVAFSSHQFHLVVVDEAQNIKNPTTAMAKAACDLKARHRICLTGTPIENHLDELWSLFHFLSPGLLGGITEFRRDFRTPIEQHGDQLAHRRLSRRTKPFVLRRTKELVATELPPKTEVVERIELDGAQRDLYESLRLAMDRRVRDLIAVKGLERSHIEMLDALLKLRQVCCDPRLVKLDSAKEVRGSAKLERLMEMLEEFRERGSRVLLFSQFTSMLNLIEDELRARKFDWVRISGETKDRDTPVRRFQSGEVSLFLISLKAGGTGLNLTAADTVIHYDPWWNPAVERQATDRAHRIGQDKSVFVFKLVAIGTVEEKILELQEKKAQLAGAFLDGEGELSKALTADDLRWVFEP